MRYSWPLNTSNVSRRILFLTPWYPDNDLPHHGVFIRDQASAISEKDDVVVVSSKVDYRSFSFFSWKLTESTFGKVKEYRIVVNKSIPVINQINYLLISVWIAFKVGKEMRANIVHGNIAYPGGIWAYCVARLLRCPFIVSDHTSRFTDNFRSVFHRMSTLFALRRAAHVIAVSTWAAERIKSVMGQDVDIVPNLIHVREYSVTTVPDFPVQIGFLGGLSSERKGLDILLKAIADIKKGFVLHIGGTGKRVDAYKMLAERLNVAEKCRFHGFVPYVPDFMKQLHFFVSSSRMEAFGMVIVEAMASGLPVVATNSGGPADFIDASCGRLVAMEDVDGLRKVIAWMIDNHHSFDRNTIRNKALEQYSSDSFLQRIDELYGDTLHR